MTGVTDAARRGSYTGRMGARHGTPAAPVARQIRVVLLLIGVTAAVGQIVLLRELLTVFQGNELSIGITLAVWLLWTAAGSAGLGRLTARVAQHWMPTDPRRVRIR
mgnify:CR=1 FL=1